MKKIISFVILLSVISATALASDLTNGLLIYVGLSKTSHVENGLVSYWKFDEAGTNDVYDYSATGADAAFVGNGITRTDGYNNGAVMLSKGTNQYIEINNNLNSQLDGATQITVSAWIKNEDLVAAGGRYEIFNSYIGDSSTPSFGMGIYMQEKGVMTVGGRSVGGLNADAFSAYQFPYTISGRWVHIAAVMDIQNKKFLLYADGAEVKPSTMSMVNFSSPTYTAGATLKSASIGGQANKNYAFNGAIDEVRIYKRQLTRAEIFALADGDRIIPKTPLEIERENLSKLDGLIRDKVVLGIGENHGFINSKRRFISSADTTVMPFVVNSTVYAPCEFVVNAFGGNYNNNTPYLEKEQLASLIGKDVYYNETHGILIFGENTEAFERSENQALIPLLKENFMPNYYVQPKRDARSSRNEIKYIDPESGTYAANPTITIKTDGTLFAACTNSGVGMRMFIYRSDDSAQSWQFVSDIGNMLWATIFEHKGDLYVLGVNGSYGDIVIRKSTDNGVNWTVANSLDNGILFKSGSGTIQPNYHTAPTPVLKANGKIYRAFENNANTAQFAVGMQALMISADENSDLLKSSSWAMSENKLSYNTDWSGGKAFTAPGWLEGNAVQAKDGGIVNILRFNSVPYADIGAIVKLENNRMVFDRLIDLPGGMSKFTIRYDEISKLYYTISNNNTDPRFPDHRNVLSLVSSPDLIHWTVIETLLYDDALNCWEDSVLKVGYQYVDWVFNGNDIVFVVRESWGSSKNYHDANRFTSYVIKDFREGR